MFIIFKQIHFKYYNVLLIIRINKNFNETCITKRCMVNVNLKISQVQNIKFINKFFK